MKAKIVVFILLVLILAGCGTRSQAQIIGSGQEPAPGAEIKYVGSINGNLPIHMKLEVKDGEVTGIYYYDWVQTDIKLKGRTLGSQIDLVEYDADGKATARFRGAFVSARRIEGVWAIPEEGQQEGTFWRSWQTIYPFYVEVDEGQPIGKEELDIANKEKWEGIWRLSPAGGFSSGKIQIFFAGKHSFYFQIRRQAGASAGFFSGVALLTPDGGAVFQDGRGGEILLTIKDDRLSIKANDGLSRYGGYGVSFSGNYKQGEVEKFTLQSLGVFPDETLEEKFGSMTGTHYNDFIKNFYFIIPGKDIDGYNARVFEGYVRGLAPYHACIVMWKPDGCIWAALLDFKDRESVIFYFTNNPDVKAEMPKTISNWIEEKQKNRQKKLDIISYSDRKALSHNGVQSLVPVPVMQNMV
jgi:hypothetical protein